MLQLSISDEEQDLLRAEAVRLGVSEEEIVRNLIRSLSSPEEAYSADDLLAKQPPFIQELLASFPPVPEEEARLIPTDLAQNVDHYVYGTRKQ